LTVLSGGESGMIELGQSDEYVGLPSGFLFAGARCVVSTLWAVYDLSSALLMDRFHRAWLAGQPIGAALRAAQRWLRDDILNGVHLKEKVLPAFLANITDAGLHQRCVEAGEWYARDYRDRR